MKKIFFLLFILLASFEFAMAQHMYKTDDQPGLGKTSFGFFALNNDPSRIHVSTQSHLGGASDYPWQTAIPALPSGASNFLSINTHYQYASDKGVTTNIDGLVPGHQYKLTYFILTTRYSSPQEPMGDYAGSFKAAIDPTEATSAQQNITFTAANRDKWIKMEMPFTALSNSATITFTAHFIQGSTLHGAASLDIGENAVIDLCVAGSKAPEILPDPKQAYKTLENTCPAMTVDLNSVLTNGTNAPAGSKVVWYDNPNHTGGTVLNPSAIATSKSYYAFFESDNAACWSNPSFEVKVAIKACAPPCWAGNAQITVPVKTLSIGCNINTANLSDAFNGNPPVKQGASLVWFDNAAHTGTAITNPSVVTAGTYYAFFYDALNQCYNTASSTAKVTVAVNTALCEPDLTPTIDMDEQNFNVAQLRDFIVTIWEVKGKPTYKSVRFAITKPAGFDITWKTNNTISQVLGGKANQNSNWDIIEDSQHIFITSKPGVTIGAAGNAVIGFTLHRQTTLASGETRKVTATLLKIGGGESNISNNTVVTAISAN
ncbi:hypothetical protein [Dyadobacter sediminis]|uniref:Uncharacterized protein n=1 Tax=Dyadobacter sediminis TaxID=1493691 RepID=A0A5R9K6S9_9BACT|nr:hypothetical protein [Dyadobacter sediminis]TLU89478.1 hypothetical protein FEM55_22325 [Dyadobacter sediminis]